METTFAAKELFNKVLKSNLIEFKIRQLLCKFSEKQNYRFNSGIAGIEEADLILMIGCNPRYEATILNSRIRKSYIKSNCQFIQLIILVIKPILMKYWIIQQIQ